MNDKRLLEQMAQAIIKLDRDEVVHLTRAALANGIPPLKAIEEGLQSGMQAVGERFENFECFLPELIGSAEAFKAAMDELEPVIAQMSAHQKTQGTVVMGTVKGDIHKIGKDIVALLLKTRGFKVVNLGEDIPASRFLNAAQEHKADIIGLSSLLNTTMPAQQEVIDLFSEVGIRGQFAFMVGGAPISQNWADQIGADGYAKTAEGAVKLALALMKAKAG